MTIKTFTNIEFKNLARNTDGDIIDLFSNFIHFTSDQIEKLTSDDWARIEEYKEEALIEMQAETRNNA